LLSDGKKSINNQIYQAILIMGTTGSGKSTIANGLAKK
jgi:tRNA A37 N6-isopentenylltransferase MiaA